MKNKIDIKTVQKDVSKLIYLYFQTSPDAINNNGHTSDHTSLQDITIGEDMCRICLSQQSLSSLFRKDGAQTIFTKIMTVCPNVRIVKNDCLPQYICKVCWTNLNTALSFKTLCEKNDFEVREKVLTSKKDVRSASAKVKKIKIESEDEDFAGDIPDDDDFQLSNEEVPDSNVDTDEEEQKLSKLKKSTGRKRKSSGATSTAAMSNANSSIQSSDEESPTNFPCSHCPQTFTAKKDLHFHFKLHPNANITCEICDRTFKTHYNYLQHYETHKNEKPNFNKCLICKKIFSNRTERKTHMIEVHNEPVASFKCEKCSRNFTSQIRLKNHIERCKLVKTPPKRKKPKNDYDSLTFGKDLFKTCAPLTTTYWSDSFSD